MATDDITAQRLRELLSYDPETGNFTRLTRVGRHGAWPAGVVVGGLKSGSGYVLVSVAGKQYRAHRLVWLYTFGRWPQHQIDHINGIRSDNRLQNLREVTNAINAQNRTRPQKDNALGFLGVFKSKNRYQAQVKLQGVITNAGSFATPEEAHEAYLVVKRRLHVGCTI